MHTDTEQTRPWRPGRHAAGPTPPAPGIVRLEPASAVTSLDLRHLDAGGDTGRAPADEVTRIPAPRDELPAPPPGSGRTVWPALTPAVPAQRPAPAVAHVAPASVLRVTAEPSTRRWGRSRSVPPGPRGRHARESTFPWPPGWTTPWRAARPGVRPLVPDLSALTGGEGAPRSRGRRAR